MLLAQPDHALAYARLPLFVLVQLRVVLDQRGDLLVDKARNIFNMVGLLGPPQEQRLGSPERCDCQPRYP